VAALDFGTGDFTVEAWVKFSASQDNYDGIVVKAGTGGPWKGWQLVLVGNKVAAEVWTTTRTSHIGVDQGLVGTTTLNDGQWHHVALVRTGTAGSDPKLLLFRDGTLEATVQHGTSGVTASEIKGSVTTTAPLYIGVERTPLLFFNGQIDEVRLSNVARYTASFTRPTGPFTDDASDVALYHFDEGSGSTAADASGNNLTLTLNNPTWSTDTQLPVELAAYTASVGGDAVMLRWETASETNNAGFHVEQQQGQTWRELAFVAGRGTTAERTTYSHTVGALTPGTYRFRLRQVDFDGTTAYSPTVEVTVGLDAASLVEVRGQTVRFSVRESQSVRAELYNTLGQRLAGLFEGEVAAGSSRTLVLPDVHPAGLYLLRLTGCSFSETALIVVR